MRSTLPPSSSGQLRPAAYSYLSLISSFLSRGRHVMLDAESHHRHLIHERARVPDAALKIVIRGTEKEDKAAA